MSDEELRQLAQQARARAVSMRSIMLTVWDVIFDAETLLAGREPLVNSRAYIEQELSRFMDYSLPLTTARGGT